MALDDRAEKEVVRAFGDAGQLPPSSAAGRAALNVALEQKWVVSWVEFEVPAGTQPPPAAAIRLRGGHVAEHGGDRDEARRVAHGNRLFFGRQPTAAAQALRWWLWRKAAAQAEDEGDAVRGAHTALHRYRFRFQTVGQPRFLWPAAVADQTIEPDAKRVSHVALHLLRTTFQTVGQSYRLWPRPQTLLGDEGQPQARYVELWPFRAAPAVVARQPVFAWSPARSQEQAEDDARRSLHTALHLYRTGFQTVGQQLPLLHRQLPRPQEVEETATSGSRPDLHRYRQAFQTVGQGYRMWPAAAAPASHAWDDVPRGTHDLHALRRFTVASVLPQPWFVWPRAAVQPIETGDEAQRIGHAGLLYPFLPHEAAEPPVAGNAQEWIIRHRRRRY